MPISLLFDHNLVQALLVGPTTSPVHESLSLRVLSLLVRTALVGVKGSLLWIWGEVGFVHFPFDGEAVFWIGLFHGLGMTQLFFVTIWYLLMTSQTTYYQCLLLLLLLRKWQRTATEFLLPLPLTSIFLFLFILILVLLFRCLFRFTLKEIIPQFELLFKILQIFIGEGVVVDIFVT